MNTPMTPMMAESIMLDAQSGYLPTPEQVAQLAWSYLKSLEALAAKAH